MDKDHLAKKISETILNVQKRFATFMNRKISGCPVAALKVSFVLLCSCFILLSISCIADALKDKPARTIKMSHLKVARPLKIKESNSVVVTAEVYRRLQQLRSSLDSLKLYDREFYDSLLSARPGMMDSIKVLESIYLKQR